MNFIRGIYNLKEQNSGCVLTIGNFDGMHRGHQKLISQLIKEGYKRNLPVIIMLFEPQPLEFFLSDKAPARLMSLREKLQYLKQIHVDTVFCIKFNRSFSEYFAHKFIIEFLVKKLNVKFLAVGDDFRFGAGRKGDFLLLKKISVNSGFEVMNTKTLCKDGKRISSTAIRQALAENNFIKAKDLLGRPFSISGRIVHGNAVGRTIGFPTVNIYLRRKVTPVKGVFVVEVLGLYKYPLPGVANIGFRPTLKSAHQQLEVYIIDIQGDFYGCYIEVVLKHKIRNEQYFSSLNELKEQIMKDVRIARQLLGMQNPI